MSFNFVIPEMVINNDEWTLSPFRFFRRGFLLNTSGGSQPSWKDVILHGNTALTLVNSKADGLNYLKLFGGTEQLPETYIDSVTLDGKCEQNGTPTPTVPVDIVCNNGAIKYGYTSKNLNVGTLENQGYTSTGGTSTSTTFCGTLWKIKVSEGEKYTISYGNFPDGISGVFVNTWKTDGTWNLRQAISISSAYTYTIPAGIGEVNFTLYKTGGITIDSNSWIQVEKGETATDYVPAGYGLHTEGTTETVTDSNQLTATAQMLLSVGDYKDTQEVLTGSVTRNVGVKVLDGTEIWTYTNNAIYASLVSPNIPTAQRAGYCTHFNLGTGEIISQMNNNEFIFNCTTSPTGAITNGNISIKSTLFTDLATATQWLATQYANGTPVIIVYPLATATTETVTPQVLQKEPVTVTGSLTGLVTNTVSSSHTTPTPTQPLPINTNNGVLTFGVNKTYTTADGQGTFVTPSATVTTRIYKAFGQLKAGKYKVKITGDFEFIFQYKDDLSIAPTNYGNMGTWTTEGVYEVTDSSLYYGVAIRNAGGSGNIYPSNFNNIGSIGYTYLDVVPVGTVETVEVTGQNLLDLANCVDGHYYSTDGIYSDAESARLSNFVKVKANESYTVFAYGLKGLVNVRVNLFDTDKTWLSQERMASVLDQYIAITVTATQDGYLAFSANFATTGSCIDWTLSQIIKGSYTVDTMPEYKPYFSDTATAEMLLKVGDYQDVQSVIDGEVTRNVGIKVFDGTENWGTSNATFTYAVSGRVSAKIPLICSHFEYSTKTSSQVEDLKIISFSSTNIGFRYDACADTTAFKAWLKQQYENGTPVIVLYPLATATTETVTGQPLTIQAGTNIVEITQASIDNLELEVSYKAGVSVTVTEIENAQLDNSVEVTVNG